MALDLLQNVRSSLEGASQVVERLGNAARQGGDGVEQLRVRFDDECEQVPRSGSRLAARLEQLGQQLSERATRLEEASAALVARSAALASKTREGLAQFTQKAADLSREAAEGVKRGQAWESQLQGHLEEIESRCASARQTLTELEQATRKLHEECGQVLEEAGSTTRASRTELDTHGSECHTGLGRLEEQLDGLGQLTSGQIFGPLTQAFAQERPAAVLGALRAAAEEAERGAARFGQDGLASAAAFQQSVQQDQARLAGELQTMLDSVQDTRTRLTAPGSIRLAEVYVKAIATAQEGAETVEPILPLLPKILGLRAALKKLELS